MDEKVACFAPPVLGATKKRYRIACSLKSKPTHKKCSHTTCGKVGGFFYSFPSV